jgi:hypothetical protein
MLDQDPIDAPSNRAAERGALCLELVERVRSDGPHLLRNVRDKALVTAVLNDIVRDLLKAAEGVPMDEILAAHTVAADTQGGIVEELSREDLHELFELTARSRAEAERSLRHLQQNKKRVLSRAAERDAAERRLEKWEMGLVRSIEAMTREMGRYRQALDTNQPLLLVKRGDSEGVGRP